MPPPVVSLIEMLLDKDPGERFQSPTELLKALPTITGAIEKAARITYQSLGQCAQGISPQFARKTGTGEHFHSQIAGYRKQSFWSGGGYRFPE